jgi:long-chain acyl-CoA synthetase
MLLSSAMEVAAGQQPGAYRHPVTWALNFEPLSLPDMLEQAAAADPRATFINFLGRRFSYGEICAGAHKVAAGLVSRGIQRGDRIGLYLPNVPHYILSYFGALAMGAEIVNLSPLADAEELRSWTRDTGVRLLITISVPELLLRAGAALDDGSIEQIVVGTIAEMLPPLKGFVRRLSGRDRQRLPSDPRILPFRALVGNEGVFDAPAIDPLRDVALVQYSAGTVAPPHPVRLVHQALTANARQLNAIDGRNHESGHAQGDRILGVVPLTHTFAQACILNRTIINRGEIILLPSFEPAHTIAVMERTGATCLPAAPAMVRALADHPALKTADLSSLRCCVSGGAALSQRVKQRFEQACGVPIVEGYGMVEGGIVTCNPIEGPVKSGTVGQPLPGTRLALVDVANPSRVPRQGEPGEIIINGPQLMHSEWHEDRFIEHDADRWLRSGDVGVIDPDGYVRILDRLSELIQVDGMRVFPSRIETMLCRHPAVDEVLVLGVNDGKGGQIPNAFATLIRGAEASPVDLRTWLNARVGRHEQVGAVVIRDSLPQTPVGKLSHRALIASGALGRIYDPGAA